MTNVYEYDYAGGHFMNMWRESKQMFMNMTMVVDILWACEEKLKGIDIDCFKYT